MVYNCLPEATLWFFLFCKYKAQVTPLSSGSSEKVERVMDQVEKYIMTRLYKNVFCPETSDDEKKDLVTQRRIRSASVYYRLYAIIVFLNIRF